jgi:TPR repeat protein
MNLIRWIPSAVAVLCLGWTSISVADPHADAKAADARGDYAAELAILEPAAEAGEVWAENNLGLLYEDGNGVKQDYALAAQWLKKAADKGDHNAQMNLLRMYMTGTAKPDDPAEAAELAKSRTLLQIAELGMNCTLKKPTATEDCPKARAMIEEGAKAGDPQFEEMLGQSYMSGTLGVPKDPAQGFVWTRKAAEQGLASSQSRLAFDYSFGMGVEQDEAKAIEWYRKAAEQGDTMAASQLADDYENGKGVARDPAQAFHWYLKVADEGILTDAQYKVAAAYAFGRGTPRDNVKAYMWMDIALSSPGRRDETYDARELAMKAIRARLTPQQLAKAKAMAAQWKSGRPMWSPGRQKG